MSDTTATTKSTIKSFEELVSTKKILLQDERLNKIVHRFNCFLIESDQNQNIKERKNESKIIVIDKILELDPYFIVIFDDTIIFISDISNLPNLISNFNESTLYNISDDANIPENIQHKLFQCDESERKKTISLMNNFSNYFLAKPGYSNTWMLVLPSFISHIIYRCYQKVSKKNFESNRIEPKEFNENEFILLDILFSDKSTIRLVFHIETEEFFIAKIFDNSKSFQREYKNYKRICHPFIPHFYGKSIFLNKECLIIEYINGHSLNSVRCCGFSNEDKYYIIIQLLIIFEYLHFNNFVYCDLKPKSLIIDQNKNLTLVNFDSMKKSNKSNKSSKYSFKNDIESIGLLIYYIFTNYSYKTNKKDNSKQIHYSFDNFQQQYSHIKEICIECTEAESKRPSITKLIDFFCNSFFKQKYEVDPNETVSKIKSNIIFPQWIESFDYLQSFYKKKLEITGNEFIENYFQEINKIHLFSQIKLGKKHYEKRYFKENINKFIFNLTILVKDNNYELPNQNYTIALKILYSILFEGEYFDNKSLKIAKFIEYGNYGEVSSLINKQNEIFIRKTFYMKLKDYPEKKLIKIMTDLSIGLQLNHPSICKYFAFYPFGIKNKLPVIFSEYASNGSLFKILEKENKNQKVSGWNSTTKIINVYGIAIGMMYLHSHNILHRNLNTKAILENEKFHPKINNLFIHRNFESLNSIAKIQTTSPFTAPEVYTNNQYTKESEIYSFGIIVYSLYSNNSQFFDVNQNMMSFENHKFDLNESVPQIIRQLVNNCLQMNPKDRPTFNDIIDTLEQNKETLNNFIDVDQYDEYIKYTKSYLSNYYEIKPFPEAALKLFIKNKRNHNIQNHTNNNNNNNDNDDNNKDEKSNKNLKKNKKENEHDHKNVYKKDLDNEEEDEIEEEEEEEEFYEIEEEEEEEEEYENENEEDHCYPFLEGIKVKSLKGLKQLEIIDNGDFANIYKVYDKQNKTKYAAKVVKISIMTEIKNNPVKNEFIQEVKIHSEAKHKTITKFIGYNRYYFHHIEQSVIFTEYLMNGSLNDLLKKERKGQIMPFWNETYKLIFIYGIAFSMSHLHSIGFIHCDLNPSNVLINKFLFPNICDFGLSRKIPTSNDENENLAVGTVGFIAPEICNDHIYLESADVYSFGMLLYVMLSKTDPFENMSYEFYICNYVKKCKRPEKNENIKDIYWKLIENCWNTDPIKRPTFTDIVNDLSTNEEFTNSSNINIDLFKNYQKYIQNQANLHHKFLKINIKKS